MIGKVISAIIIVPLVIVLFAVVVVLPLGLLGFGVYRGWDQDRQVRQGVPTTATVIESRSETSTYVSNNRTKTRLTAIFRYRYTVGGRAYDGDRMTPLGRNQGTDGFAVVQKYPPGSSCPVYYLPDDPARSYVLRQYSGDPYAMFFAGLGIVSFVLSLGAGFVFARERRSVAPAGWTGLKIARSVRARSRVNLVQAAIILGLTAFGGWHMFTRYPDVHHIGASIVVGVFTFWGGLFLLAGLRARLTRGAVGDARVRVENGTLRPGASGRVHVEQPVRRMSTPITEVRVGLVCTQQVGSGKYVSFKKYWDIWQGYRAPSAPAGGGTGGDSLASRVAALEQGATGDAVRTIVVDPVFPIPPEQPPSRAAGVTGNNTFYWTVEVVTILPGRPDYRAKFDVTVG